MRPILLKLFGFSVQSYAVMMVLGYALAFAVLRVIARRWEREGRAGGLDRWQIWDLYIVMVVSSVLGAKIGHVLFEAPGHRDEAGRRIGGILELLKADPWHWARLGEGGYVWYGGFIGALISAVVYFRRRPALDAWLYADAFAPAIMAGAVIGRLGCLLAGCCFGQPTELPWAIRLPGLPTPVHPTQLYDAAAALVLSIGLYLRFWHRRFSGENIGWLLIGYPMLRSLTEIFRGDADRGAVGPLSTSQLISIPLLIVGLATLHLRRHLPRS